MKTHEKVLCFGFIMCGVCQEIFAWDLGIKRDTIRQANKNIVLSKKNKNIYCFIKLMSNNVGKRKDQDKFLRIAQKCVPLLS